MFRADLKRQLKAYEGTFFVRNSDYSDVDSLKEQMAAHPNDLRAKGLYALALIKAHANDEAQKILAETLKGWDANKVLDATDQARRECILAGAHLAMQQRNNKIARELLE